jgi:predicted dienelactone hydrolase
MRRLVSCCVALFVVLLAADHAQAGRWRYADPGELGLYPVGHSVFEAVDPARNDRTLRVEIWYPADPDQLDGPGTFYDFQFLGLGLDSPVAYEDTAVAVEIGFPLVIFSHGSCGVSFQSTPLMETLASHGMVVVAPNHTGNSVNECIGAGEPDPFFVVARNRPLDVSFLIDLMFARGRDPSDEFYAKINERAIAVAGHSFGGFTALAAASGFHVPAEGIDIPPDPRVAAIVPIAPASGILSDAELQSIEIPVLLVSGTLDDTTPIDDQTTRPWALVPSRPFYRADIVGATHLQFANACDIGQALLDIGVKLADLERLGLDYVASCLPPALDISAVREAANLYVTAFLKKHLLNDSRYDEFLTSEYALTNAPGVMFQRKDETQ